MCRLFTRRLDLILTARHRKSLIFGLVLPLARACEEIDVRYQMLCTVPRRGRTVKLDFAHYGRGRWGLHAQLPRSTTKSPAGCAGTRRAPIRTWGSSRCRSGGLYESRDDSSGLLSRERAPGLNHVNESAETEKRHQADNFLTRCQRNQS